MTITFTVDKRLLTAAVPELPELPDAVEQVLAFVIAQCDGREADKHLHARIAEGVLNALLNQSEMSIGEVLAFPTAGAVDSSSAA